MRVANGGTDKIVRVCGWCETALPGFVNDRHSARKLAAMQTLLDAY